MALSFVYLAFVRVLELLRLQRCDTTDLAIEVIVLRHEVACLASAGDPAGASTS